MNIDSLEHLYIESAKHHDLRMYYVPWKTSIMAAAPKMFEYIRELEEENANLRRNVPWYTLKQRSAKCLTQK